MKDTESLSSVFMWMFLGLFITGGVSFWTTSNAEVMNTLFHKGGFLFWGLLIVELFLVYLFSRYAEEVNELIASALFIFYAAINGLTLSVIFLVYVEESIYSTFFITSAMFGIFAVYGYVTKRDLSDWGSILYMALIGLILALIANMFIASTVFDLIISIAGVGVFVALTAYDIQKLEDLRYNNSALIGALTLYLDFINLFLFSLRLFGIRVKD